MRTKRDEPRRLFPLAPTQDLLHRTLQVVVPEHFELASQIGERQLVRFQERLLRGSRISSMKRSAARHAPQTEDVELAFLPVGLGVGFIPIHLAFAAPGIALRDETFPPRQPHRHFFRAHIFAHRRLGYVDLRVLHPQPPEDPPGRVPLLAVPLAAGLPNRINERDRRRQLRLLPFGNLALTRHGASQRLSHHPPVDPQLPGNPFDRLFAVFVLTAYLFK